MKLSLSWFLLDSMSFYRVYLLACLLLMTTSLNAQQRREFAFPGNDLTLLNDLHHVLNGDIPPPEELTEAMRRFLDVEFDEIKRVCELNDGQTANLEIAAQGAVETAMEDWIRLSQQRLERGPVNRRGRPMRPPAEDEAEPLRHKSDLAREGLHVLGMMRSIHGNIGRDGDVSLKRVWSRTPQRSWAKNHEIWIDAVDGILSKDQKAKLAASRKERETFKQLARAHEVVVRLDGELHFSSDQRRRIVGLLKTSSARVDDQNGYSVRMAVATASQLVEELTTVQKSKWEELAKSPVDLALEIVVE